MSFELLARKGREFIEIKDFSDQALAMGIMQQQGENGIADNWDLSPEGANFYWECKYDRETNEVWMKRLPPENRTF